MRRPSVRAKLPVGFAMDMSLSFRTTIILRVAAAQLLSASKLVPFAIAASPITATTFSSVPFLSRAAARPSATESATPACPAIAASAFDSFGFGKPDIPPIFLSVGNSSQRPVSSFHAYAWCPTSHTTRSRSGSNTSRSAIAISTAPSEDARCPPFFETVSRILCLTSSAFTSPPPCA